MKKSQKKKKKTKVFPVYMAQVNEIYNPAIQKAKAKKKTKTDNMDDRISIDQTKALLKAYNAAIIKSPNTYGIYDNLPSSDIEDDFDKDMDNVKWKVLVVWIIYIIILILFLIWITGGKGI